MPPVTEEGLNTFGCRINGTVWTPYSNCSLIGGSGRPQMTSNVNHIFDSIALPVVLNIDAKNTRNSGSSFWITSTSNRYSLNGYSVINGLGNLIDSIDIEYYANSKIYHSTSLLSVRLIMFITKTAANYDSGS